MLSGVAVSVDGFGLAGAIHPPREARPQPGTGARDSSSRRRGVEIHTDTGALRRKVACRRDCRRSTLTRLMRCIRRPLPSGERNLSAPLASPLNHMTEHLSRWGEAASASLAGEGIRPRSLRVFPTQRQLRTLREWRSSIHRKSRSTRHLGA